MPPSMISLPGATLFAFWVFCHWKSRRGISKLSCLLSPGETILNGEIHSMGRCYHVLDPGESQIVPLFHVLSRVHVVCFNGENSGSQSITRIGQIHSLFLQSLDTSPRRARVAYYLFDSLHGTRCSSICADCVKISDWVQKAAI